MENLVKKENKFFKDKIYLTLLIIIIILAIFIRMVDYQKVGYVNDDMGTIPAALLWFYPANLFPSFGADGEPPLGIFFIGAGCMLSGEDFSGVKDILPNFYPGREMLLGQSMTKAENYCHLPIYIVGILFFIVISIFAFLFLKGYGALYLISFFAFFPYLLQWSRYTKTDIISWFFVVSGLIFLYKFYTINKESKKELIFLILSAAFFGFAQATKESTALFFLFLIFIILEKYKEILLKLLKYLGNKLRLNIFTKIIINEGVKFKWLILNLLISVTSFLFCLLLPYKLNPKIFLDVYKFKKSLDPNLAGIGLNKEFINAFLTILSKINIIDVLIFIFSTFILFKLLFKKEKDLKEKFILYLLILLLIALLFFPAFNLFYILLPYLIGLILLMSLTFSDASYSIFNLLKIQRKKIFFGIFLIIYIIFSFSIALSTAPYFEVKNPITCHLTKEKCGISLEHLSTKATADYLKTILKEHETFMLQEGIIFFYLRNEQGLQDWNFDQAFIKKFGRNPTVLEKIKYFHPNNQTIRYLLVSPTREYEDKFTSDLQKNYKPNHKIILNKIEATWIYDIQNLTKNE